VGREVAVVLHVLRGLAAAGKKATLLQLLDGWRKGDKASSKAWTREQQEQVGYHVDSVTGLRSMSLTELHSK
jgi:hypothetical protein